MELYNKCNSCENVILWDRIANHLSQAGTFRTVIITTTVTIVLGLFAFAVSYGELRSRVNTLSEQMNKIERNMPYGGKAINEEWKGKKA